METWSDVVTSYPANPEPNDYAKAIRFALSILSEDLAPFETEWLFRTLLFRPVDLFETVSSKRYDEDWWKAISDSLKILSVIVEKFSEAVEKYFNNIIQLCMLPFDPHARKNAIMCLLALTMNPSVVLRDEVVSRHISALEEGKNCKAPRALLVGNICKYHPALVQEHFTRIWRIYLNMLQPTNKTDEVANSVLYGISGLLEHFGDDIEIQQINGFYDTISRECITITKCSDVLLKILKDHARLFKERLAKDQAVRRYLWQKEDKKAMDALTNIYKVILPEVQNKEEIINSEVIPCLKSPSILIKQTALRIIIQAGLHQTADVTAMCSSVDLEFQLRVKKLSYEEANTVSCYIESSVDNNDTMLLTAIVSYDNLPTSKKRDIVVNGILNASDDVRKAALIVLLKLCLEEDLEKYIDIWRVLLNNTTGPDLGKAVVIFEEALYHILEVIASFTEKTEKPYEDVKPVLSLMATLLSLHKTELNTDSWCQCFKPTVVHLAKLFCIDAVKMISETNENEKICVEMFEEDTVLSKLLSTLSATSDISNNDMLLSLQVIFSSEHADLKVMCKALSKLQVLIQNQNNNLDKRLLSEVINQISKLKCKNKTGSKDARIFQVDATMFLGKYGHMTHEECFTEDIYLLKLKNKLALNIPNIIEATTFKIDLQRILQLCLLRGDTESLYSLLVILTASLCDRTDPGLQEATIRVIHALFRTNIGKNATEIAVYPALVMCHSAACVQVVMKCITEELSPTVRRKLSDSLQVLLTHEPCSEVTGELLKIVGEQTAFLISRDEASTLVPGLDIIRAFVASIGDNNSLIIDHLPNILSYTSNIQENDSETFEMSSKLFIDKIDLFTKEQVTQCIKNIFEKYSTNSASKDMNLDKIMGFIKRVMTLRRYKETILVDMLLNMCQKLTIFSPQFSNMISVLAHMRCTLEFNSDIRTEVVLFKNCMLLDQLVEMEYEDGDDKVDAVLVFLKEYAEELIEVDPEKTLQCLGNCIENIQPRSVLLLSDNLTACLRTYKSIENYLPIIQLSYEKWYNKLDLQNISECIQEKKLFSEFSDNFSEKIYALKIMSELLSVPAFTAKEWTMMLLGNASEAEFKWGRIFLTDMLALSEKSLTDHEFENMLENHLDFVKRYMSVYFNRLKRVPFVLKAEHSCLLVEIIDFFAQTYNEDNNSQDVVDLVAHLWPSFLELSTFDDKLSVLLKIRRVPHTVGLQFPAVNWAIALLATEGTSQEDRIKLIGALPPYDQFSVYYRMFASYLPVRLSEMQGRYIPLFRALLDTLATTGDMTLLDIVVTLAGGDDAKGWWDYAIDACISAVAAQEVIHCFDLVYKRVKAEANLLICNRIFLPLLRHTSRKFCETYISTIVTEMFNDLRVGSMEVNNETYRKRIVNYAITFNIMKVVFEKATADGLENGNINRSAGSNCPWYFLEQTCKYCVTVSTNVKCPTDASPKLRESYRWLQCSSYNCFSAAICRRKLSKNMVPRLFNVETWTSLVDKDAVYPFELQAHATYWASKPTNRSYDALATSANFTGTVRSSLFRSTLSENPLHYDMIAEDEDDEEEDDFIQVLDDSVLNAHGCVSTLKALFEHASTRDFTEWRSVVAAALTSDMTVNAKWLVAQAICIAGENLKPHASALCPPLLHLIAETSSSTDNGKPVLNNLHVDIISTIIKWNFTDLPHDPNMNTTVEYMINTCCIVFKDKSSILKRLFITLNDLLKVHGKMVTVKWSLFQDYCEDLPNDLLSLLPMFTILLKNGVALPEILPAIFSNTKAKHWTGNTKLATVCGLALSLADNDTRKEYLAKFWQLLNSIRSFNVNNYVRILYSAQNHCYQCCDLIHLKIITDLASKLEKSKCLTIISTYLEKSKESDDYYTDIFQIIDLSELFDSEYRIEAMKIGRNSLKIMSYAKKYTMLRGVEQNCLCSSVDVKKEAYSLFLTAFQELFKREDDNPSKRKVVVSSPILNAIETKCDYEQFVLKKTFDGMFDLNEEISKMMADAVEECLSKDINMRFAELFYIIVYQCSLCANSNLELANYGTKLLQMLFSDLRSQDAFKLIKLRDEGLPQSTLRANENITVNTRTTVRTAMRFGVTYRQKINKAPPPREIDVQKPITDILNVVLELSKTNSQVCQELCAQMMKCLQDTGRRFYLGSVMASQLFEIMKRKPFCLTPIVLDACRIFIKDISSIQGFNESVKEFMQAVSNSEGYMYTKLLYEDLQLRSADRNLFVLRTINADSDAAMQDADAATQDADAAMQDAEFTLQGLKNVFGALSNWDDLRLQDKRQVEESLPPLWTRNVKFTNSLREYFDGANKKLDYGHWFNKMVASYYPEKVAQNRMSWLEQTERWPKRDFVTSAVIEAIQWHQNEAQLFGDISSSDCLAEWAARLMIRSAYYNKSSQQSNSDSQGKISFTKEELIWCQEANERKLPHIVIQCINRNKEHLLDVDILPWVHEKVKAHRTIDLKDDDLGNLQKALEAAELQTMQFAMKSSFRSNIDMQNLILQLNHDLETVSMIKLDDIMKTVSAQMVRQRGRTLSYADAQVLKSFYDNAMLYYDEQWIDNDETTQNYIIQRMTDIIDKVLDHNLTTDCNLLMSMLLNRLANLETPINDETAKDIRPRINRILPRLDFFSIAILKTVPVKVLDKNYLNKVKDADLTVCTKYFQLICDANYSLLQYCNDLKRNVLDETKWSIIFNRMKARLFETKLGGTDYLSLITLKYRLYDLEDISQVDSRPQELEMIIEELRSKPQRATLRLSQLCPDLCSAAVLERKRVNLQRLLRLSPNVYVVKFAEQISVFTDSVRRPCVIKALLSDGSTRRYIIKTGEPMYHDACVQRAVAILPNISKNIRTTSYNVTPLGEDSALIEYLEDHVRLRSLMEEVQNINVPINKVGHEKWILTPSVSMEQYNSMCQQVTPYILRSAIEKNCSCVKEFIEKKRTFEDTLSSMTMLNWLFGVGDRHLQNIMYNVRDGGVCGVDWASIFQYGCHELPPARLTANILAVCDIKVLESRLQSMLLSLRESHKLFLSFLKTLFFNFGPDFKELSHLKNILQGNASSFEITRDCITESRKKYKNHYLVLLEQGFRGFERKEAYSVEEQVSCLLRHCTEPRFLSVAPPGWEAWL